MMKQKNEVGKANKINSWAYAWSLKTKVHNWGTKAIIVRTWTGYEEHYEVEEILEAFILCCFLCFDIQALLFKC